MHHISKGLVYLLWGVFFSLLLGFFVGFARYNFDIQHYLHALQTTTLSSFSSSVSSLTPEESGELSGATQERTGDSIADGLNVYDPAFADDFSDVTSGVMSSGASDSPSTGGFGFVADTGSTAKVSTSGSKELSPVDVSTGGNPKKQLLDLIKARELKK